MFKTKFNPLMFLMSLGAGGIAVAFFVYLQYVKNTSIQGLVNVSHFQEPSFSVFIAHSGMIIFGILHLVLSAYLFVSFYKFIRSGEFASTIKNPLTNSTLMASVVSIFMTFNVFIAVIRYFVPTLYNNFQDFMLPGLLAIIFFAIPALIIEIYILKQAFVQKVDLSKINFGWLLQAFAMAMVAVTSSGIAALSKNLSVASWGAFVALVFASFASFLLFIKLPALFKVQLGADGLPDRKFLPSFLIIVPITTLLAITTFRLSHYAFQTFGMAWVEFLGKAATIFIFAFQTWFLLFGIALLWDYFTTHFKKESHVSQWGLICPFVAYPVLGAFVYKFFASNLILETLIWIVMIIAITLFAMIFRKQIKCALGKKDSNFECLD